MFQVGPASLLGAGWPTTTTAAFAAWRLTAAAQTAKCLGTIALWVKILPIQNFPDKCLVLRKTSQRSSLFNGTLGTIQVLHFRGTLHRIWLASQVSSYFVVFSEP